MSNRLTKLLRASGGNAGTQGDFLDECWQSASPGHLGTHGNAETLSDSAGESPEPCPCVPERSRSGQERNSAQSAGQSGLCSRVPEECTHQQDGGDMKVLTIDWAAAARDLTGKFTDPAMRQQLFTLYYHKTLFLQSEGLMDRDTAEREAYGWLLTRILNLALKMQLGAMDAIK